MPHRHKYNPPPPPAHNRPPAAQNRPPVHPPPAQNRPPVHPPAAQNRPPVPAPAAQNRHADDDVIRPATFLPPPPPPPQPPVLAPPAQNRPDVIRPATFLPPPPPPPQPPVLATPAQNRPDVVRPATFVPLAPPPPLQPLFQPPLQPPPPGVGQQEQADQGRPGGLLDDLGGAGVPEEPIVGFTSEVLNLFPDAEEDWVRSKVRQFITHTDVVTAVCNHMLENPLPSKNNKAAAATPEEQPESSNNINFFTDYENPSLTIGPQAENQAHRLLQNEFRRLSCRTIGAAMALFNHHYAPTKKCLQELIDNNEALKTAYYSSKYSRKVVKATVTVKENGKDVEHQLRMEVNKTIRGEYFVASVLEPQLQQEVDFFQCDAEDQLIECGCCYGDTTFDDMVQCLDGHLFCQTCLQSYAQEATYGEGKAQIVCMTDGCDSIFPRSQLVKALNAKDLSKYDDRVGEESLQLADMGENLVRCPFCNYAALMEEGYQAFQCQAADCKKETCRYCKEEWKDHFGIPCDEIEKKSDTKVRVSYEERMSMAKIRTCHRCKAGFTKSEGCNKMTCRCGAKMCYICRMPNIDYKHFCGHVRDPGHPCTQCNACSLWTNPEEDDERAVQEIQKEMEEEKKAREKRGGAAGDGGPDAKKPSIIIVE